jgi:hypothetical protein
LQPAQVRRLRTGALAPSMPANASVAFLDAKNDLYGGVIVNADKLPSAAKEFELRLHSSLHVCPFVI